jgi:5'(3')-deoxyribonucleotidase
MACGSGGAQGDKGIIAADCLINDRARHFARFKGCPLLFSAPRNAGEGRYPRVDSWKDVRDVFARLELPFATSSRSTYS